MVMRADFRDTSYWKKFTSEERENYEYLIRKFEQSKDDVINVLHGEDTEITVDRALDLYVSAANDLALYERHLLVKYWKTNVSGSSVPV
jgi:hypothetical protein